MDVVKKCDDCYYYKGCEDCALANTQYSDRGKIIMSRSIQLDSNGNDITCMKEFDVLKYPCDSCDKTDCEEREEYEKTKSKK